MKFPRYFRNPFRSRVSLTQRFSRALGWVHEHTGTSAGVAVTSVNGLPYPEVSGYFIPTLLQWGERELALKYGRWLVSMQNPDGSWSDPAGTASYTFDTGQILKGLLALVEIEPEFKGSILRGCDWILGQVQPDGRVTTPDTQFWLLPGGKMVPEAIHLYALEPLRAAASKWGRAEYEPAVARALAYYLADPALTRFDTLSHFHAYIVEALLDLGQEERAAAAMKEIALLQARSGAVPGYQGGRWICSTGLLQYAKIWYRLGQRQRAERAFSAACRLQNRSGGFFGSYGMGGNYFPREEISWAVKYFLDAFWWKIHTGFEDEVASFPESIAADDGRYRFVAEAVSRRSAATILEAGCGKGRFLRGLQRDFPKAQFTGLDLSPRMLSGLPERVTPLCGSLLHMPIGAERFDLVFCVEALEHAVNLSGALSELCRAVAPGGTLVIIDKNVQLLGRLEISEWEQWFEAETVAELLQREGLAVTIERNIPYDGRDGSDGLFLGWVATKI